jgi:primosomal protein N' (replication factor Y)
MEYALVAINLPVKNLTKQFLYYLPTELSHVGPGWRVLVPFGPRKLEGFVVATTLSSAKMAAYVHAKIEPALKGQPNKMKSIIATIGTEAWFDDEMLATATWMSKYYMCTLAEAMRLFIPGKGSLKQEPVYADGRLVAYKLIERLQEKTLLAFTLSEAGQAALIAGDAQKYKARQKALEFLQSQTEPVTIAQAAENAVSVATLNKLVELGWAERTQVRVLRNSYDANIPRTETLTLTAEQTKAVQVVTEAVSAGKGEFLLQGITGSGKTEVYLRATEFALKQGKQVLVLVPEIALTTQIVRRFQAWFKDAVSVVHSKLSQNERADVWYKMRTGKAGVLIGVRSAVFAPFKNLGLVIIDEEHESSYKQEERPNYHAKTVARQRCQSRNAVLLLGSATPSLESYYKAINGEIGHLRLTERPAGSVLPEVAIVDMRAELEKKNFSVLSEKLRREIIDTAIKGHQAIILLNRRGFSTFVMCRECGETLMCPHCEVSLVYHKEGNVMRCHYCGNEYPVPTECPKCHSKRIKFFGTGTQKAEEEIGELHGVRIIRMDQDSTGGKLDHEEILKRFATGEENVLLGTQMVAKGHDIPNVVLVGILAADSVLNLPDFRSGERAFSLLTQAAGRAGRGNLPGKVVIQSYAPDTYVIELAAKQDYDGFAKIELETRQELNYPPYSQLLKLVIWHKDEQKGRAESETVAKFLKDVVIREKLERTEIAGPFPALVFKVRDKYRFNILVKSPHMQVLKDALYNSPYRKQENITIDVDPLSLM